MTDRLLVALAAAHGAVALALLASPLTAGLGFERAMVTGLAIAATAPLLAADRLRRAEADAALLASLRWNLTLLAPSLLVGLAHEALVVECDSSNGLQFFLLIAGGNAAFGTVLGHVVARLVPGVSRPVAVVAGLEIAWLCAAASALFRGPSITLYVTPLGFWPGSIYDEALDVEPSLWAFRGFGALLGLGLLFGSRVYHQRSWTSAAAAAMSFALAVWVHAIGGFADSRGRTEQALSRRIQTEHFVILADPSLDDRLLAQLAEEHEFRYAQLAEWFGVEPKGRIRSYVFRNQRQKGQLIGASRTQIARPWQNEIYLHGAEHPHPVLKHELAHVFAGALSPSLFRVPMLGLVPNIGLIEGVAVAADNPVDELDLSEWASAMLSLGKLPSVAESLDPLGFWSLSSARAYTAAGAFVRWLVRTRGMDRLAELYAGRRFEAVYEQPAAELERQWRAELAERPPTEANLRRAAHRFARPSIFEKTCARASASLRQEVRTRVGAGDLDGVAPLVDRLFSLAPWDPAPLLWLGRAELFAGRPDRALALARRALAAEAATEQARSAATELTAEIAWRSGDLLTARAGFAALRELDLSAASERLQTARLEAMEQGAERAAVLLAYLSGELPFALGLVRLSDVARAAPDDALSSYLYARVLERVFAYPEAYQWLPDADALPAGGLRDEARLTRGRIALALGRSDEAAAIFEEAARLAAGAGRAEALDWAARARDTGNRRSTLGVSGR